MPFSKEIKSRIFIKSARICPLCFKQCGINIEAAHIVAEAKNGSNEEDNAIPLCFDCHQEIGSYDDTHPKGNKFTEVELKERRNKLYELVEKGALQALIIARRFSTLNIIQESTLDANNTTYKPSIEVTEFLSRKKILNVKTAFYDKLKLFNEGEQAYILDSLLNSITLENNIELLMSFLNEDKNVERKRVVFERILRKITLSDDLNIKNVLMEHVPLDIFSESSEGVRLPFFKDIIFILKAIQFEQVNKITNNVVRVQDAIPDELLYEYVEALFGLAKSSAWTAEPIANTALKLLPDKFALEVLNRLDENFLSFYGHEVYKDFIEKYKGLWPESKKELFHDYLTLKGFEFDDKYT